MFILPFTYLSIHLSIYQSIYLSIFLSIYLSIFLSINQSLYLSIYQSINQSIYLSFYQSIYPSIFLSINLSIYLAIYLYLSMSVCLSLCLCLPVYLSTCLSISLSIYLSICLSVCLSVYLSFCLSTYLSALCLSISPVFIYRPLDRSKLSLKLAKQLCEICFKVAAGVSQLKKFCKDACRVAGAVKETSSSEMAGAQGANFLRGVAYVQPRASDFEVCTCQTGSYGMASLFRGKTIRWSQKNR